MRVERRIQDEPFVDYQRESPRSSESPGALELAVDRLLYSFFILRKMLYTPTIKLFVVKICVQPSDTPPVLSHASGLPGKFVPFDRVRLQNRLKERVAV